MALKAGPRFRPDPSTLLGVSRYLLDALTVAAALFTGYVVIGGIWTGQSTILTDAHPAFPLLSIGVVTLLIGGLEGLQISVSNLQKKDLAELNDRYPGAVTLHGRFMNDDEVTKRFFGGRQFLIVALVFVAARLTTFPAMRSFPFTDVPFPDPIAPWFQFLFLDLGLLGALFVLWLGNLTAQFVATDHPVEFLDVPGMGSLFSLCVWVDRFRLPRPANWLSAYFGARLAHGPAGTTDRGRPDQFGALPVSPEERWRRELESESGFALTSVTYEWRLYGDRIERAYTATYLIGREGIETIVDDSFLVPKRLRLGSHDSFRWTAYEMRDEQPAEAGRESRVARWLRRLQGLENVHRDFENAHRDDDGPTAERGMSYDKRQRTVYLDGVPFESYVLSFSNRNGCFEPGTKVRVEVEADLVASPAEFTRDRFFIDHPCAGLDLRIEYRDELSTSNRPHLYVYNPVYEKIPGSEDRSLVRLDVRSVRNADDGAIDCSTYSEEYPRDRSRYEVVWDVEPKR